MAVDVSLGLDTSVQYLKGVGPKMAANLNKIGIKNIWDLINHYPFRHEDFSQISKISQIMPGQTVTLIGQVASIENNHTRSKRVRTIQKAAIKDSSGQIEVIWFNQPYLAESLRDKNVSLSGKVKISGRNFQMVSPKYEIVNYQANFDDQTVNTARIVPIYSTTATISNNYLRKIIKTALEGTADQVEDFLPEEMVEKEKLIGFKQALRQIHFPSQKDKLKKAKKRIAFNEVFLLQLKYLLNKSHWQKNSPAPSLKTDESLIKEFIKQLPFTLTEAQKRTSKEILADIKKTTAMNRLLQGDVGSGKTVVAAMAAIVSVKSGYQAVIMAPTEILAQQHAKSFKELFKSFNIKITLVTGSVKTTATKTRPDIIIGTHALLHRYQLFEKIGLVVIDEQHRFGVSQRAKIAQKSSLTDKDNLYPHILTMTATPIPRTISLTMYGDLDVSYINQMPKGRKPIKTFVIPSSKRKKCYQWVKKQIRGKKDQVFIICPLIEESETLTSVKDATSEFEKISKIFPEQSIALVHGKLKASEKESILKKMKQGKVDILVATPVVEVGIDIPKANVIIVETANRFGLSQLHQLRGRVGRNQQQAYCFLFANKLTEKAKKRLAAMEKTNNGMELAEIDLKIRGPGEIYGTSQHGFPELQVASFTNISLIQKARVYAQKILRQDPFLEKNKKLKQILTITSSNQEIALN